MTNTSGMFSINVNDVVKGGVTAVLAGLALAVFSVLNGVFQAPGFDVFSVNWVAVGHAAVNAAIVGAQAGFSGYVMKNYLSDSQGKVLGKMG